MPDEPGVPLVHYLQHAGTGVRFHCEACGRSVDVPIADVARRLQALGRGDLATGIRQVGRLVDWRCRRCGGRRFETRPAFPPGRPLT